MSRKRAQEYGPNYLTQYKEHVGMLAAILMTTPQRYFHTEDVVRLAMEIIDEVDKTVDAELEQTGRESGVR